MRRIAATLAVAIALLFSAGLAWADSESDAEARDVAQTLDRIMEGAALDLWRGFPTSEEQRLAVSTIKPDWLQIDDHIFRRANNALERALLRVGQGRGHTLLARTALHNVIGELEKSGLGRDVEALRLKLLDDALADILVVAEYYLSNDSISMSLQAVRIENAQVLSGTREYLLPLRSRALTGDGRGSDQRSGLVVGETFRDCPECPEMVVIPSGSFMMGSPESEEGRDSDEGPVHRVSVRQPFAIGKYEVTSAEWDAYVSDGGCYSYWFQSDKFPWARGNRPVVKVNYEDAKAYTAWLSRKTGHTYRLPGEAEWEYAARAGTTTRYHFGNNISSSQANIYGSWKTVAVGSYPPNAFGLHDMHGNVFEWIEDCWNSSYAGAPSDTKVWTNGDCSRRVLRGGSWESGWPTVTSRGGSDTRIRTGGTGFRIARTLP